MFKHIPTYFWFMKIVKPYYLGVSLLHVPPGQMSTLALLASPLIDFPQPIVKWL